MATIFNLPDVVKVREQSFKWNPETRVARTKGRFVERESSPYPVWTADFDVVPLEEEDFGKLESFFMKASTANNYFRAYKTYRPRPLKMDTGAPLSGTKAVGGGAFNGTAALNAIIDSLNITISGLPANFIFTEGDMLEIAQTSQRLSLHMIGSDAIASAGGIATLVLNNPIDENVFTTAASVILEKASCLMQIIDPPSQSRGLKFGNGSFSAEEIHL